MRFVVVFAVLVGCEGGESCDFHAQCSWDQICFDGSCEDAFDRLYQVGVRGATVGPVHPDGLEWDSGGDPPDLFAEVSTEAEWCTTDVDADDYSPEWWTYCDLWFSDDPFLAVELWDYDRAFDEYVAGWSWDGPVEVADVARTNGEILTVHDWTGTVALQFWVAPYAR